MRWPFIDYPALAAHERLSTQLPSRTYTPLGSKVHHNFECEVCGVTDPDRFYSGYKTLCGLCRNRWQREKKK